VVAAAVQAVDRVEIVVPEIRRLVDAALADVARARFTLPRAVRVPRPGVIAPRDSIASIRPDRPNELVVNPQWPHWSDAQAFARRQHAAGRWSTPLPAHPVIATIGSLRQIDRVGIGRVSELAALPLLRVATLPERA